MLSGIRSADGPKSSLGRRFRLSPRSRQYSTGDEGGGDRDSESEIDSRPTIDDIYFIPSSMLTLRPVRPPR